MAVTLPPYMGNFDVISGCNPALVNLLTDTGRCYPGHAKGSIITKLFVSDGKDEPLDGICVYFLRDSVEDELNSRNIAEVSINPCSV